MREQKEQAKLDPSKGNSTRISWVKVLTLLEPKGERREISGLGRDGSQLPPKSWSSVRFVLLLKQDLGQLLLEEETKF